jgi:hypothetical protein
VTLFHGIGAWKAASWIVGFAGAALFTFIEKGSTSNAQLVIVAVTIAAVPPTVTGIFGLILQTRANRVLHEVKQHVNGMMTQARSDEQAASKRADTAEGFKAGSDSERERTPTG